MPQKCPTLNPSISESVHSKGFLFLLLDWVLPTSRKQDADEDPPKHVCGDMEGG